MARLFTRSAGRSPGVHPKVERYVRSTGSGDTPNDMPGYTNDHSEATARIVPDEVGESSEVKVSDLVPQIDLNLDTSPLFQKLPWEASQEQPKRTDLQRQQTSGSDSSFSSSVVDLEMWVTAPSLAEARHLAAVASGKARTARRAARREAIAKEQSRIEALLATIRAGASQLQRQANELKEMGKLFEALRKSTQSQANLMDEEEVLAAHEEHIRVLIEREKANAILTGGHPRRDSPNSLSSNINDSNFQSPKSAPPQLAATSHVSISAAESFTPNNQDTVGAATQLATLSQASEEEPWRIELEELDMADKRAQRSKARKQANGCYDWSLEYDDEFDCWHANFREDN